MRLSSLGSGLSLAAVLLFTSTVFAQHHEASAPSSPPPSPAPSAAPSPAPASAPTPAPSAPASASFSHGSEASAPVSARAPESHLESGGSAGTHTSGSIFTQPSSGSAPTSGAERVIPANKITNDDKLAPTTRIGESSSEKERVAKPGEPYLRRRICVGSDCKEPVLMANPPQSDLRHRICPGGVCHCPPGQTAGKGGCVATSTDNQSGYQNQYQTQCPAGRWWNGTNCSSPAIGCVNVTSRAELLLNELRSLATQVRDTCTNNSTSAECDNATMRRDQTLQQYRMLQNEATPDCRAQLPEPPL
jgi:hypothetical protein